MTPKEQYLKYKETYNTDLSFSEYKNIVNSLNSELIKEIFLGKVFNMGFKLGSLAIIQKERVIQYSKLNDTYYTSINWPKSKENKKKLIEEGKLPLAYKKDEKGKIIGSNGGEKWQIFNNSPLQYFFYWNRSRMRAENLPDGVMFSITYSRHYHFAISRHLHRELYDFAIKNNINYTNVSIT